MRVSQARSQIAELPNKKKIDCFRGLEHENVLLPAGRLQFRAVVDSVEQRVLRPGDLADGPRGVPKPPWLIRRPGRRRIRATSVTRSRNRSFNQTNLHGGHHT